MFKKIKNHWRRTSRPLARFFIFAYLFYILFILAFSINWFGRLRSFTNKSNSMSPAITTGSIIVVKKFSQYQVGDMISYYSQIEGREEIVTHRLMSIGGNVYTTKGDANEVADREIVRPRLVIGRVVWTIPVLGHLLSFAKSFWGMWLSIVLPAIIIIIGQLFRIIKNWSQD